MTAAVSRLLWGMAAAVGLAVLLAIVATGGSRAGTADPAPEVVHSPAQVDAAFASVGLDLVGLGWTVPRGPELDGVLKSEMSLSPPPGSIDLHVVAWSTTVDADHDASILEQLTATFPDAHWLQTGSVTLRYTIDGSPQAAATAATVSQAMDALAAMSAATPPASGVVPLATVSGSTAAAVRGKGQVHIPAYDWWCRADHWVSSDGPGGPDAMCGPWDAGGVELTFGFPDAASMNKSLTSRPLDVRSYRAVRQVGVTRTGWNRYVFPFDVPKTKRDGSESPAAAAVAAQSGLNLVGTGWRCAARTSPASLTCFRVDGGSAISPFVVLHPGSHVVEVDAVIAPELYSTSKAPGSPRLYGYDFYA